MKKFDAILSFTRKEKNALLVFITLMLMIWILPKWFHDESPPLQISVQEWGTVKDSIHDQHSKKAHHSTYNKKELQDYKSLESPLNFGLHEFDPNKMNIKEWQSMGVSEKTASTIQRYLSKGGRFNKPQDLHKIWGMSPKLAEKLMPYVHIELSPKTTSTAASQVDRLSKSNLSQHEISINAADSTAWEALPGIGPVLASRIVAYRNRLGGFYTADQLKEVYGLSDSLFQQLKDRLIADGSVAKMDVNLVGEVLLQQHPYIGKKLSVIIKNYRNQHGNFKSLEDIQNIVALDEISYNKIRHYLKVNTD
jgi:competence protein ComEA